MSCIYTKQFARKPLFNQNVIRNFKDKISKDEYPENRIKLITLDSFGSAVILFVWNTSNIQPNYGIVIDDSRGFRIINDSFKTYADAYEEFKRTVFNLGQSS